MKLDIAYKIVRTYSRMVPADGHTRWHGSHEIVAIDEYGRWDSPDLAKKAARKITNEYARHGVLCWQYPQLNVLTGDDKLVISVHPIILMDGVEVETDHMADPILSLTVSKAAIKDYCELRELRDEYNFVNRRSGHEYTKLY